MLSLQTLINILFSGEVLRVTSDNKNLKYTYHYGLNRL